MQEDTQVNNIPVGAERDESSQSDHDGSSLPNEAVDKEPVNDQGDSKAKPNVPTNDPPKSKSKAVTSQPAFPLPNTRMSVESVRKALAAYAAYSNYGQNLVQASEIAETVGIAASTLSSCSAFIKNNGFVTGEKGKHGFRPSKELLAYSSMIAAGETEKAILELQPLIEQSWFGTIILQLVRSGTRPNIRELKAKLASAAQVDPKKYDGPLSQLLEWAELTQMIKTDMNGGYILGTVKENGSNGSNAQTDPAINENPAPKSDTGGFEAILNAVTNTHFTFDQLMRFSDEERQSLLGAMETIRKFGDKFSGKENEQS